MFAMHTGESVCVCVAYVLEPEYTLDWQIWESLAVGRAVLGLKLGFQVQG